VDDGINLLFRKQTLKQRLVADIAVHEAIAFGALNLFQILQVTRIGQGIQVDHPVIRITVDPVMYKIGPDEPSAAGNKYFSHCLFRPGLNRSH